MSANPKHAWGTLTVASAAALILAISSLDPQPWWIWNVSESVATGLYTIRSGKHPAIGDLVVVRPPERLADFLVDRGYLGRDIPLIKRVAAVPGQSVCRIGTLISIDGIAIAPAQERDRSGRPLPQWSGCRTIRNDEVFLLNWREPASLDSRYFGPLPSATIIGRAIPLWTREAQ